MIGFQDTCNCAFGRGGMNTEICYYSDFNGNNGTCDDDNLDQSCPAMLQGAYRYERMLLWMSYLRFFYGPVGAKHRLIRANVGHDYTGMMMSRQGQCILFGYRCSDPGVLNATSVTPGIYQFDDFDMLRADPPFS
jgi:hypothetical protein